MGKIKYFLSLILFLSLSLFTGGQILADIATTSVTVTSLSAPSNLQAVAISQNRIDLSWSEVAEAVSYKVYIAGTLFASSNTNSYSATGLNPSTSYSFTVSAVDNSEAESAQSSAAVATTLGVSGGAGITYGIYEQLVVPSREGGLIVPPGGFKVLINNGKEKTADAPITINLDGGTSAVKVEISNNSEFVGAVAMQYEEAKNWILPDGDGEKTIYVRFFSKNGEPSPALSVSIVLDTKSPEINISKIENVYLQGEEIIIEGTTSESADIALSWGESYKSIKVSANELWAVSLGAMPTGIYSIIFTAKDDVNNQTTIEFEIAVIASKVEPAQSLSFSSSIFEYVGKITESASRFIVIEQEAPLKTIIILKDTPKILQGEWNLLPIKAQK